MLKIGVIGFGCRGQSVTKDILLNRSDVEVVSVCDVYQDRVDLGLKMVREKTGKDILGFTDDCDLLASKPDAVYIATSWETHIDIAIRAMRAGVIVAMEVCPGFTLESIWDLVHTYEETKTPFMFMENCCFGKDELLATSLLRNGVLGDVVYGEGCYAHYLASEIAGGNANRHYRLRHYLHENFENYPTHELGPLAKAFNVNRGNRIVSVISLASRSAGMKDYVSRHNDEYPELVGKEWQQGDVVDTLLKLADGSTLSLRLDTTLPRSYSRNFTLRGTRGSYWMDNRQVFLDGEHETFDTYKFNKTTMGSAEKFEEKYLPECWSKLTKEDIEKGHGGMDYLLWNAFVDAVKNKKEMPLDVYDGASWMAVSVLSAQSIAQGGIPQAMPDFTNGAWISRPATDVTEIPIVN